jgi:hypothetical protein
MDWDQRFWWLRGIKIGTLRYGGTPLYEYLKRLGEPTQAAWIFMLLSLLRP